MPSLPIDMRRINTRVFSFVPSGAALERLNPADDFSGDNYAARLFIGFNVGDVPTWQLDEIIRMVIDLRAAQHQSPDATYLATKGVFTHGDGKTVIEDGCQVIMFAMNEAADQFQENILQLAEELVVALRQEAIYVEFQRNGLQTGLFRARP